MKVYSNVTKKNKPDPEPRVKLSAKLGAAKKKFVPGDLNPHVRDRKTTMEHGADLGEHPEKTKARIAAQDAGKKSYTHKGREEYSGRHESERKPEFSAEVTPKPIKLMIPKKLTPDKLTPGKSTFTKKEPVMKKAAAKPLKRRLERVGYLQGHGYGRNKKTESGH